MMNSASAQVLTFPTRPGAVTPPMSVEFSTEPEAGFEDGKRWTRVRITRQEGGEYFCEKVRGPMPLDVRSATVDSLDHAREFFGGGWIVKELFAALDPARFPRWN